MHLLDILACPRCRADLVKQGAGLSCTGCGHAYPVEDGVPILLPTDDPAQVVHEAELETRGGYVTIVQQVFDSLGPNAVILDLGAGNRNVADERIVRMDVLRSPHVDIVGDAHALPFKDDVITFLHASAVWEHLRRPWIASKEVGRILQPGGNAFVDCAFVYPFHGYPAVFFNASVEGLRTLFEGLVEVCAGVAPWHMPSFAIEGLLSQYHRFFKPDTEEGHRFVEILEQIDTLPLRDFDRCFELKDAERIAAVVFVYVRKAVADGEAGILPVAVAAAWAGDPALQERYRDPQALAPDIDAAVVDNMFTWARGEGRAADPAIAAWLDEVEPFTRRLSG
ncbi:MAG: hypothetical protein CMJ83_12390 [Planctomycetes bacterium]|nr:hypothetical protein [Planctomycetota bacterium]